MIYTYIYIYILCNYWQIIFYNQITILFTNGYKVSLQFEERILKQFLIKQTINLYETKYLTINYRNIMLLGKTINVGVIL